MSEIALLKPGLYRPEGTAGRPDHPALLGGECACGYVFFPLQTYGCEKCGRSDPHSKALAGAGTLLASARVHLHPGKGREAPFTVGAIRLEDGPVVRTLLDGDIERLRPGQAMTTKLVRVTDAEGGVRLDLRFTPEA